jgi:hypothetical protein
VSGRKNSGGIIFAGIVNSAELLIIVTIKARDMVHQPLGSCNNRQC